MSILPITELLGESKLISWPVIGPSSFFWLLKLWYLAITSNPPSFVSGDSPFEELDWLDLNQLKTYRIYEIFALNFCVVFVFNLFYSYPSGSESRRQDFVRNGGSGLHNVRFIPQTFNEPKRPPSGYFWRFCIVFSHFSRRDTRRRFGHWNDFARAALRAGRS